MRTDLVCPRLNDVPIALADGGTANLSHFCGQKLVVFFCPAGDPDAADREIETYERLASAFVQAGVWVLGIVPAPAATAREVADAERIHLGLDPDGAVFSALAATLPADMPVNAADGAAFLIDRDGAVRTAWPGCGHAADALATAHERP